MKNRWVDAEAKAFQGDDLAMRVYTSRLLGQDDALVLHGGGNTSVKSTRLNFFDEEVETLYIKGSGWDLKTIEKEGFAPIDQSVALKLSEKERMSDFEMVTQLRLALLDPNAPDGSIETLVHASIPYKFIDHTHADAILVMTNSPEGQKVLETTFPDFLILPYVMPGFDLAKQIQKAVQAGQLDGKIGIILRSHGIFTFADDGKLSYDRMIEAVGRGEKVIESFKDAKAKATVSEVDPKLIATIRSEVSKLRGSAQTLTLDQSEYALVLASHENAKDMSTRGPMTPDHTIRTKRTPAFIDANPVSDLENFKTDYIEYYEKHHRAEHTRLDLSPRWAILKNKGILSFGKTRKEVGQISDIAQHTAKAILDAEAMGGWEPLAAAPLFEIEYWELEQRKLKKGGANNEFQGKVAIVTGAAHGIGRRCADDLIAKGACVVGLDISKAVLELNSDMAMGVICDISNSQQLKEVVELTVKTYGGLDIIIANAGIFTAGAMTEDLSLEVWNKTLTINLTSHQQLLHYAVPYLKLGVGAAVVFVGSRNVGAPGPGASAYSVSKAGITQLARVLSMELAPFGVRVNVLHPDAVFDTELWTADKLIRSAERYGMTVEQYKTRNLLKTEIKSKDVSELCISMCSSLFGKTTGAQIPIDGGNDRII